MLITKPFRETVRDRALRDPEFLRELVREFAKEVKPRCSDCGQFLATDRIHPDDWAAPHGVELLLCDNCF